MSSIAKPGAVIFDLDGTLLDTEPLYTIAAQQVVAQFGKQFTLDIKRRIMGGNSRTGAEIVIKELGLPIGVDEYLSQRASILIELFKTADEIKGATRFMQWLADQPIKIGLATSSPKHFCDIKLNRRSWSKYFDQIICGDDSRLQHSKPAPDIFLLCAEALGIPPTGCLVFEDSLNGVNAGIAANMQVIGMLSPWIAESDLDHANSVVEDFDVALEKFKDW